MVDKGTYERMKSAAHEMWKKNYLDIAYQLGYNNDILHGIMLAKNEREAERVLTTGRHDGRLL